MEILPVYRRIMRVHSCIAALVGLLVSDVAHSSVIDIADPSFTVSKGKLTTDLKGGGFTKNSEVQIEVTDPTTGENVPVGTVGTDSTGNFNEEWPNTLSTAAAIGGTVHAIQGTTDVTVTVTKDTGFFGWILEKLISDAGPLRTDFTTTELANSGFTGTVNLIAVSSNANIVNATTTFNAATDTITTIGFFDALAFGPVIGTYEATGTFTNLFDPLTNTHLTGPLTLTDSTDPIGFIVPEPGTLWMMLLAAAGLGGVARRSRRVGTEVRR